MSYSLIIIFFFFVIFITPVFAEHPELLHNKTQSEIKKLDLESQQIQATLDAANVPSEDLSSFDQSLILAAITIIGSVVGTAFAASIAWYKVKMVPPLGDQEKMFRELVKKDLDSQYKEKWDAIRERLLNNNATLGQIREHTDMPPAEGSQRQEREDDVNIPTIEEKLKMYCDTICKRRFPNSLHIEIRNNHRKNIKYYIKLYDIKYMKRKIWKWNEDKEKPGEEKTPYEKRIDRVSRSLTKSLHSEYFEAVEKALPDIISLSVATSKETEERSWEDDALYHAKMLMILGGISEYEEKIVYLIDKEIKTKLAKKPEKKNIEKLRREVHDLFALMSTGHISQEDYEKNLKKLLNKYV